MTELRNAGVPFSLFKLDTLLNDIDITADNQLLFGLFDRSVPIMADKAIEIVRKTIHADQIAQSNG